MIIASFRSVTNAKTLPIDRTWKWAFLGTDRQKRLRLTHILGEAQRFPYAKDLHQVMDECRQEFLDRLGEIGRVQSSPLHWWATRIASKSSYQSDLFLKFCFFKLIIRWDHASSHDFLVIVEDLSILQAVSLKLGANAKLMMDPQDSLHERISGGFWKFAGLGFAVKLTYLWALNVYYRLRHRRRWRSLIDNSYDVMIYSWVEDRSFANGNKKFIDHYLGRLAELYGEKGFSVARVTPVTLPGNLLPRIYLTQENIIPLSAFIKLRDILRLTISKPMKSINFGDDKHWFAILCRGERGRESYVSRWYLLNHQVFKRFWNSYISKLKYAFIYPFENQPWEKMLLMTLREMKHSFSTVGYQHSTMPRFLLNYHLGKREHEFMPFPDLLISNGTFHENLMNSLGYPCKVKNGGSLRYSVERHSVIPRRNSLAFKEKNVLVLLGPTKLHALELVDYIIRIAPRVTKNFLLKAHPDLPASRLNKWLGPLPVNLSFVEGPLEPYLGQAAYAIHMGTTSALECFRGGMQIFKYLPEVIDIDPLYETKIAQMTLTWNLIPSFEPRRHQRPSSDTEFFMEPMIEDTWMDLMSCHERRREWPSSSAVMGSKQSCGAIGVAE